MKNRDVTSMLMGLTVAWNMYGFATNFFNRAWREAPVPVVPISYGLNAAIAVFAPLTRSGKRGTTLISSVLGILMAVWSAVGVFFVTDEETELAPALASRTFKAALKHRTSRPGEDRDASAVFPGVWTRPLRSFLRLSDSFLADRPAHCSCGWASSLSRA